MTTTTLEDAKVGDKVWDTRKGWGVVAEMRYSNEYPILVNFGHNYESYTLDGYYFEGDVNPSLFWDEIVIEAPPKPLPDLPVDAKVLVWLDGDGLKLKRHFSHFENGLLHTFDSGKTSWTGVSTSAWVKWELVECHKIQISGECYAD